MHKITMP